MVSARNFVSGNAKQREKRQSNKNTISASDLVIILEIALEILASIDALIKFVQSDRVPLSDVYDAFVRLKRDVDDMKGVTKMERNHLRSLIKQRQVHVWRRPRNSLSEQSERHSVQPIIIFLASKLETISRKISLLYKLLQGPHEEVFQRFIHYD
jgi:hypothetical protein